MALRGASSGWGGGGLCICACVFLCRWVPTWPCWCVCAEAPVRGQAQCLGESGSLSRYRTWQESWLALVRTPSTGLALESSVPARQLLPPSDDLESDLSSVSGPEVLGKGI